MSLEKEEVLEAALAHSDMVLSSVRAALDGEPLNDFQLSIPIVREVADLILLVTPCVDLAGT